MTDLNVLLLRAGLFIYLASTVAYLAYSTFLRKKTVGLIAFIALIAGLLAHTAFQVVRVVEYWNQHQALILPTASLFEAISYCAWMIALVYVFSERYIRTRLFGAPVAGVVTLMLGYAMLSGAAQAPRPLMPALKSPWLNIHVTAMMLSYAGLLIGSVIAAFYLMRLWAPRRAAVRSCLIRLLYVVLFIGAVVIMYKLLWLHQTGQQIAYAVGAAVGSSLLMIVFWLLLVSSEKLFGALTLEDHDLLAYKFILFAFPILTAGIITGAIWADQAWGRFWGWDPKETWSLITWVIWAGYLHTRIAFGWRGARSAWFAIAGIVSVFITFLGVNYLVDYFNVTSLHSY